MPAIFDRVVQGLQERYARIPQDGRPTLALRTDQGPLRIFGSGEPQATLVVRGRAGMAALRSMDLSTIAEAYVAGDLDVEGDLLQVLPLRTSFSDRHPLAYLMRFLRPLMVGQVRADRAAIPEHYDRDPEFFLSFMDRRHRAYSHGFFERGDEPLEDAVTRKLQFALDAVGARPGDRVLDIGGGWGSMTEFAGRRGIRVTSLTISEPSRRYIADIIAREKLPCEVVMEHFFEHNPAEKYDAIVNLGVTEHLPDYPRTLGHYDALLKPGGKVYLDASAGRRKHAYSAFFERHIFRGNGGLMCLHEYMTAVAGSPFEAELVANDRRNYALTARHWAQNLERARDEVVRRWGEPVYRIFRLYLWGCVDGFERGLIEAYHVVLARRGRMAAAPTFAVRTEEAA
jgi:cyclopropane-fatty-acyl-phospholipid synthase